MKIPSILINDKKTEEDRPQEIVSHNTINQPVVLPETIEKPREIPVLNIPQSASRDIDYQKLEINQEKLRIAGTPGRTGNFLIVIALLIIAITIIIGVWSQYQQSQLQLALQEKQAKSQFELRAAEIVANSASPEATYNKAKLLVNLFPNDLPANFADSFVPDKSGAKGKNNKTDESVK